ncbi:MAG: acetyl-CoA carboxylase carboxyltransferase subunit alpha [Kiritimatiellae bacterium]|nr:acetyl-CoA carboxylase carboxyltransferase subunit alpha [Kiritimatiellia bacterium]
MNGYALPFEKPVVELRNKLEELRKAGEGHEVDMVQEVERIQKKIRETQEKIYSNLTPWQQVQIARHPTRPYPKDYIDAISTDFTELHGDRLYADDRAIIGGIAQIDEQKVMFIATQKGRDTKSNLACNFGCPYPEGYRKALRLMKLAGKFGLPIVSLIDTPGAFPGMEGEERHVAEAIAVNLREMSVIPTPIVVVITGEGGSGGAIGIGVGDRLLIMEHAYYSVISPEGCAAILWKDRAYADKAAEALKITSRDLTQLGLVDEVIAEPLGGAHNEPEVAFDNLKTAILKNLSDLQSMNTDQLLQTRYEKIRAYGKFTE